MFVLDFLLPICIFAALLITVMIFCKLVCAKLWPNDLVNRDRFIFFDIFAMIAVKIPSDCLAKVRPRLKLKWQRLMSNAWFRLSLPSAYERAVTKTKTQFSGIDVNIYTPKDERKSNGAIMFFHGGGFCLMSADWYDKITSDIAFRTGTILISVNYGLAPEHPFPEALEDCYTATVHLLQFAHKELNIDPRKVVLMGDSAGGNLAVVVGMRINRELSTLPKIMAQVVIYPVLQMVDINTSGFQMGQKMFPCSSILNTSEGKFWLEMLFHGVGDKTDSTENGVLMQDQHHALESRQEQNRSQLQHISHKLLPKEFLQHATYDSAKAFDGEGNLKFDKVVKAVHFDPNISPMFADDSAYKNTPPTLIQTVHYDLLRDDGFWYAERLRQNNVNVHHKHYDTYFHGILNLMPDVEASNILKQDIVDFLANILH